MDNFWTAILDFAHTTTTRVGEQLLRDFGQVQATHKSDGSLVTQADKWADREIQDAIASNFNGYGILSEEGEHIFPDTEWCWVTQCFDQLTLLTRFEGWLKVKLCRRTSMISISVHLNFVYSTNLSPLLTLKLLWSQRDRDLSAQICALLSIRLQELLVLCVVRAVALSKFSGA